MKLDSEEDMLQALQDKKIAKGDVIIIRYEGPKGGIKQSMALIYPRSGNA